MLWPREGELMNAMVIGEDAFIHRSTRVDFQRSGTYHVLVVSGMNVTILAMVTFWTLRRLRLGELTASAGTMLLTVSYAVLTNVGPPIWRATLMECCSGPVLSLRSCAYGWWQRLDFPCWKERWNRYGEDCGTWIRPGMTMLYRLRSCNSGLT